MLKIVGEENGKVVDEKILLDEKDKPTKFLLKFIALDILCDLCIFSIFYGIFSIIKKLS